VFHCFITNKTIDLQVRLPNTLTNLEHNVLNIKIKGKDVNFHVNAFNDIQ